MVAASQLYPGRTFDPGRRPRPPGLVRGLVVGLITFFVLFIPLSNLGQQLDASSQSQAARGPLGPPAPPPSAKFEAGPTPGTIVIQFSSYVPPDAVTALAVSLGMTVVSGDAASARFVLALPQAEITPGPNHTAFIYFPRIASASDIATYFERNRLTLMSWRRDPEGVRYAIVSLPNLQPRVLDARLGYFGLTLPLTDRQTIDSWASASGMRVITYDATTGEAVMQPLNWRPPVVRRPTTTSASQTALLNKLLAQLKAQQAAAIKPTTPPVSTTTTPPTTPPTATSAPPAATELTALATDGHVTLSWPAVVAATGYQIYRTATGGQPALAGTTTDTSLVDIGGTVGTTYTYQVVPQLATGTPTVTPMTATIVWPTTSSQPTIVRMSPTGSQLTGSVQLVLDGRTGDGTGQVTWFLDGPSGTVTLGSATSDPLAGDPLAWTSTLTWDSTSVADGAYTLRAVVHNGSASSTGSQTYRVNNGLPPSPVGFAAASVPGGVALTWQQPAFADAALYQLYRDGGATPIVELASDQRSYVDNGVAAGVHSYSLVLKAANGQASTGVSVSGTAPSVNAAADPIVAFRVLLPSGAELAADGQSTGRLMLQASAAPDGAATFEYSADVTTWTTLTAPVTCQAGSCATDWNAASLAPGHYGVRARSGSSVSQAKTFTIAAAAALPAPTALMAVLQGRGVALHWSAPDNASPSSYSVWKSADADWQLLDRVIGTSFLDEELEVSDAPEYRVQSVNADGVEGQSSASVKSRGASVIRTSLKAPVVMPAAPAGLRAVWAPGGVGLLWNAVASATGYVVERSWSASGPFVQVGSTTNTIYFAQAGSLGGRAYFRVRSTAGSAAGAASSPVAGMLIPTAPAAEPVGGFALAGAPALPATVAVKDLVLSVAPATSSPATAPAPAVLAGRTVTVAASGRATTPIATVRVETTATPSSAGTGQTWQAIATLPASTATTGWTALGPLATSTLAEGTYQVRVSAIAAGGATVETTEAADLQVVHGALAPLAVTAQVAGTSVLVSWNRPGGSLPLTYSVYRQLPSTTDYVLAAARIAGTVFQDRFLPGASNVGYVVTATDSVGNESAYSGSAWTSTPSSWYASGPALSILTPAAADALMMARGTTVVSADAASNNGIASIAFASAPLGSNVWTDLPTSLPLRPWGATSPSLTSLSGLAWAAIWNTAGLSGSYLLRVTATDRTGKTTEQVRTVTFCSTCPRGPPSISLNAVSTTGGVRLAWSAAGADLLQVRRSAFGPTGPFRVLAQTQATTYQDSNLIPGVTYAYQLWSANGAASATVSAAPLSAGGQAASGDGTVNLAVPSAAGAGLNLVVSPAVSAPAMPSGLTQQGSAYEINATSLGS
ncbi:MAG: hypothetical protein E6J20_01265, partial [Chloroflexi bacterium]